MLILLASAHGPAYQAGGIAAIVVLAAAVIWLGRRTFRQPPGRARTTDAIAALVCAALLVGALVRVAADRRGGADPWDTPQARELHAGFVAGCQQGNGGAIDCDCVFERLTGVAPFDTPEGFANLGQTIERTMPTAVRTGDVNVLPAPVVDALRACVAS